MISAEAIPGITHAFFTREGGYSSGVFASLNIAMRSGDDRALVAKNRETIRSRMGAAHLVSAWQHHSADALTVTGPWDTQDPPKGDALVTNVPGIALGISTADCGPVLFADPEARVVGGAHAGWGGALKGVTDATLDAMEKLGAKRERVTAILGPMISQASYETGPEFIARFAEKQFFKPSLKEGHYMFDLPGYITMRLKRAGVGRVIDLALCTYRDEHRFFSYRRTTHRGETHYGCQLSCVMLREE